MIPLLGITISMIARVLAQVIENLCVLQHRAGFLCQRQELIYLPIHESFGNMMRPKGDPEFFPSDDMIGGQHGTIIIPPDAGSATLKGPCLVLVIE